MRLLNNGERYNQIIFAVATSALASRWLQKNVLPLLVSRPEVTTDRGKVKPRFLQLESSTQQSV